MTTKNDVSASTGLDGTIGGEMADRIVAIDGLRGLAVFLWGLSMTALPALYSLPDSMLRNGLADEVLPSIWHGLTLYDLILPAFLMAAGASLVVDLDRRRSEGTPNGKLALRILARACLLFLIGLVCEWWGSPSMSDMRFTGVFQRIAVCYFFAGVIGLLAGWRLQAVIVVVILLEYWALLEIVEVPGYGAGDYGVEGNVAAYVDRWLLPGRTYSTTWDPQGILSTLPALALALVGMLLGRRLLLDREAARGNFVMLIVIGILAANCGILARRFVPLNPHMLTPSFVVAASGLLTIVTGLICMVARTRVAYLTHLLSALGRNALPLVVAFACLPELGIAGFLVVQLAAIGAALFLYHSGRFFTVSAALGG